MPVIFFVDRELTEKGDWDRVWAVALLRFGEEGTLDLRGAQGDVADNASRCGIGDDVHARGAVDVVRPGVPAKPHV
jgi:hypothetical protein